MLKSIDLRDALANVLFVFLLCPYMSPVPIPNVDSQPLAYVAAIAALALQVVYFKDKVKFNRYDGYLFLGATFYFLYFDWWRQDVNFAVVRRLSALFLGLTVIFALRGLWKYIRPGALYGVVWMYLIVTLVQLKAESVYMVFSKLFLSATRTELSRGMAGPTNEPSLLALMSTSFIVCLILLRASGRPASKLGSAFVIGASAIMLALSGAGTGLVAATLVLIVYLMSDRRRLPILALAVVVGVGGVGYLRANLESGDTNSRGGKLLAAAITDPSSILADESANMRLISVVLGVTSVMDNPIGTGEIKLPKERIYGLWNRHKLERLYSVPAIGEHSIAYALFLQELIDIGTGMVRMGLLFFPLLALYIGSIRGYRDATAVRALVFLVILNGSIGTSIIWLFMAWSLGIHGEKQAEQARGLPAPVPSLQT